MLGDVMVDVVARLAGPVAPGSDAPASISFGGGGSAANVAAWLAFAGCSPALVARIGRDDRGARVAAELSACGVDARLALDDSLPTGTCIVLVDPGGERSMLPDPGANVALAAADLPDDLLVAGGHLHVAGYTLVREGPRPAALAAIGRALEREVSVSVDPSSAALLSPAFLDELSGVGLLLPNAEEAAVLSGEEDAQRAALALARRVLEVVVTLGPSGALWTDGTRISQIDGERVASPIDTTGAGDAFAAGFLVARLSGAGPEGALREGCRLAAVAVRTSGARPA